MGPLCGKFPSVLCPLPALRLLPMLPALPTLFLSPAEERGINKERRKRKRTVAEILPVKNDCFTTHWATNGIKILAATISELQQGLCRQGEREGAQGNIEEG